MPLYRIVYFSLVRAQELSDIPGIFDAIAAQAALENPAHDITGGLVYGSHYFAQALEGRRRAVSDLLGRIYADPRNVAVQVASAGPIRERLFEGWAARDFERDASARAVLLRHSASRGFTPAEYAPSVLLQIIARAVDRRLANRLVEVEELGWDEAFNPPSAA